MKTLSYSLDTWAIRQYVKVAQHCGVVVGTGIALPSEWLGNQGTRYDTTYKLGIVNLQVVSVPLYSVPVMPTAS